ncbi:trehalose-phosphatase [Mycobacterium shimoidei]|uniref:Trehalose 6-phosphate phosphatase n=1 Tax=Mycobacterium shimoidei TaxID=29313 RepID=A0A1E3TJQ2_MYCSH|nr:trehalose-phosphatase [Mycobacterium shimoidei]MCV7257844.1 trehalose-phosphatase [Mycobacterium shimoidei]ODR14203.1 trehalose-phosphatase [Mycobacterium shimoidei]ORW83901.1 trehalose phosphatase [Mycobacterium shimoidei]SRX91898.1 Trehalose 6-phosphate phosphatase OtsB2 (trehalose-phosphatase) (TPP) [Mycobacterium tuberculosis H37Rv] [Mycobacterium shimoidei]
MAVTIDPRRHDAVLFDLGSSATEATLLAQLRDAGVRTAPANSTTLVETARRLSALPGRCAVVTTTADGIAAARAAGFALVIGLRASGHGADAVVSDQGDIQVRRGDRRMSQLPDALDVLDQVAAQHLAVFYDFDGTLSEIVNDPDAARLAPGAADALTALTARCPVAILSGRDLADVRQRIGLPGIWYAGSHGFELTGPRGEHHQNEQAAASIPVLEQAAGDLRDELATISGVAVEHKRFGVAVHYRNAARDKVGEVAAAVRAAGRRTGLRVTTGREVIELRPDINWDKGKTLRWVLDHIRDPAEDRLFPIYLGDDITDEDAFDAVRDDGVGIVVRHDDDGDRATAASYALDSPDRVVAFTEQLARRLGHDQR